MGKLAAVDFRPGYARSERPCLPDATDRIEHRSLTLGQVLISVDNRCGKVQHLAL